MSDQNLERLLREVPDKGIEKAPAGLADQIKSRIPARLTRHKLGTINIIVDLRINKLTAAAAIILTVVLLIGLLGLREPETGKIYQDGRLLLRYCLEGEDAGRADMLADLPKLYEGLVRQGKEAVYYGDWANLDDKYAIVMHWKLPDGRYTVVFADLTARTISPQMLIRLQARMLHEIGR